MVIRLGGACVAIVSVLVVSILFQGSASISAAVPENSIEFQDGAGNVVQSVSAGDTAIVYIRDSDLATVGTCTGTWTAIDATVTAGTRWSLATGSPRPVAYTLSEGCGYDRATSANTPLTLNPAPTATVNGVTKLVTCCENSHEIALFNDANAGSTVRVDFYFDLVDAYSASNRRARVYSTSDPDGEWVGYSEVASEMDASANPTSDLFRGEVSLSGNPSASANGDGSVWVQNGDTLSATFYEADGANSIASDTATVYSPTPTVSPAATSTATPGPAATPVPAAGRLALILLGGSFALLLVWRLTLGSAT
jgi:hypothetical protein